MKKVFSILVLSITAYSCSTNPKAETPVNLKKLQHIVLIKFKESITPEQSKTIEEGAYTLNQIKGVNNLNYTTNVSPEGLTKGYTHSLTMYFEKAKDRDEIYLPHPVHRAFVKLFVPFTTDILVYDYWDK